METIDRLDAIRKDLLWCVVAMAVLGIAFTAVLCQTIGELDCTYRAAGKGKAVAHYDLFEGCRMYDGTIKWEALGKVK